MNPKKENSVNVKVLVIRTCKSCTTKPVTLVVLVEYYQKTKFYLVLYKFSCNCACEIKMCLKTIALLKTDYKVVNINIYHFKRFLSSDS